MTKKISLYGILTALCIILGYVEFLINFTSIAPGVKIGLANSLVLILVARGDIKGAVLINVVRIVISTLLFSSPFALVYSVSAAALSMLAVIILRKIDKFGLVGLSVAGAAVHNLTQLAVASLLLGGGVWYYLPVLIISAVLGGIITGTIATLVIKRSDL